MTREEVAAVNSLPDATAQPVAKLLYGSGVRIMEAVRLRGNGVGVPMKPLTIRAGKGDKDRLTTLPTTLMTCPNGHRQMIYVILAVKAKATNVSTYAHQNVLSDQMLVEYSKRVKAQRRGKTT